MSGGLNTRRCAELAQLAGGTPAFMDGVCMVQLLRADLAPTILGARTRSPLVLPVFFSFESVDGDRALDLGEAVLRQEEVNTVMRVLRENGIIVTALHNHWLFEEPRLMYMHWEARMDPERFLRVSLAALRAAKVRTMPLEGDGMIESGLMDAHRMHDRRDGRTGDQDEEMDPFPDDDEVPLQEAVLDRDREPEREQDRLVQRRRHCTCERCSRERSLEPWYQIHDRGY